MRSALADGIDLSVSSRWQLDTVAAQAAELGRTARIHLKIDTGLSRNGCYVTTGRTCRAPRPPADAVHVVGIWSHFAYADEPGHPTIGKQLDAFRAALDVAQSLGVGPELRHIANSAATLTLPEAHFDLVRPGIAVYGLDPGAADRRLRPRARDDTARLARVGEARARRRGRLLRPRLHDRRATPRSRSSRSATPTASRATRRTSDRCRSTASGSRSADGCAWTSSSSTSATCRHRA